MNDFQINYEITKPDYAEANALLLGRTIRFSCWQTWALWGAAALLLALPVAQGQGDQGGRYPLIVVPFALFLLYYGLLFLFPGWSASSAYAYTGLAQRSYTARFSPEAVRVTGANVEWAHPWASYKLIRESNRIFLFYDGMNMFIFAKRYFAPDRIALLQRLVKECWKPIGTVNA
jgi:hypothetical protein